MISIIFDGKNCYTIDSIVLRFILSAFSLCLKLKEFKRKTNEKNPKLIYFCYYLEHY